MKGKTCLVTGGSGFLGRHLSRSLAEAGATVFAADSNDADLREFAQARYLVNWLRPHCVFHLAGENGGIRRNADDPATIFFDNTAMAVNVLKAAHVASAERVVAVVASCAYPESYANGAPRGVMEEGGFFDGPPHASVAAHAYAKRNLQLACSYYARQHGLRASCVCPATLYGPGMDFSYDNSKVLGGLIRRFLDAARRGRDRVTCWGSGHVFREFLHVRDCASLVVRAAERYACPDVPLNLSSGQEFLLTELVRMVARATGFGGEVVWDAARPDGQKRKSLDRSLMRGVLGEFAFVDFEAGLREAVEDCEKNWLSPD